MSLSGRILRTPSKIAMLFTRSAPFGLFSLVYFQNNKCELVKLHREIAFSFRGRIPAPLWFLFQCMWMYRWRWFSADSAIKDAVDRFGAAVEAKEGISIGSQIGTVKAISKRYCIPPEYIYRYNIYRSPESALDFIYPSEAHQLHRLQNGLRTGSSHIAIQDKLKFSTQGRKVGLPVIPTIKVISKSQEPTLASLNLSTDEGLFIKSRLVWRVMGAFSF